MKRRVTTRPFAGKRAPEIPGKHTRASPVLAGALADPAFVLRTQPSLQSWDAPQPPPPQPKPPSRQTIFAFANLQFCPKNRFYRVFTRVFSRSKTPFLTCISSVRYGCASSEACFNGPMIIKKSIDETENASHETASVGPPTSAFRIPHFAFCILHSAFCPPASTPTGRIEQCACVFDSRYFELF